MKISNTAKFLTVGLTAGLSSVAHAFNAVTVAATTVAISHPHLTQKTTEVITNPENMNFIQRHPFIAVGGLGLTVATAFAGVVYTALSSLDNNKNNRHYELPKNDIEDKNSIIEKIKKFKENFSLNSLKSNSPSPK